MENIETNDSASGSFKSSVCSGSNQEIILTNAVFQIDRTGNQNYPVKDGIMYLGEEQEFFKPINSSCNVSNKNGLTVKEELSPVLASGSRSDDNEKTAFICVCCGSAFNDLLELGKHQRLHEMTLDCKTDEGKRIDNNSDKSEKINSCDNCGDNFTNKNRMLRQQRTTLDSHESLQIKNITSNNNDIRVQPPGKKKKIVKRPYECSVCSQCFEKKSYLILHMRVHTGEKPYKCSVCSKQFRLIGHIKSHMSIHLNERPFECSVCHKKFARKDYIRLHMKTHTGEKPHVCPICKKPFSLRGNMERHMKSHK